MKAAKLRALAIQAYWAAKTPTEAKMAGILTDLFAPDLSDYFDRGGYSPKTFAIQWDADRYRGLETVGR